jgi:hypothetical protein
MDRIASSYNKKNEAENSAVENTKKVRNLVHSLMAGQDAEGQKLTSSATKEDLDNTNKALDLGYKQQQLLLKQKYSDDETIQKEYHVRMLANELAYMQAKLQLTTDEEAKIDLQSQLIDKQREFTEALKEATPELLLNRDSINQRNISLFEEAKLLSLASQKQTEGAADLENYTAKQQMQTETIKGLSDIMSGYITDALTGSIDEYQTFGDTLILMSLQMLKMMVPIWSAMILGYSLADPISVATVGIKGMINYAIVNALLLAGISAVEGVVKSGIDNRKKAANSTSKYATGGYTHGETTYIAGESGEEWIAPNWMVTHPATAPLISGLDKIRETGKAIDITSLAKQNGTISNINMGKIRKALVSRNYGFANGSFASVPSRKGVNQNNFAQTDKAMLDIAKLNETINLNSAAIAMLMKDGVRIDIVTFKRRIEAYENIINQTGLRGFSKTNK